jgi:hypothetical protein
LPERWTSTQRSARLGVREQAADVVDLMDATRAPRPVSSVYPRQHPMVEPNR